jgi:cbb3-type cytochrome oxidase subunit 3
MAWFLFIGDMLVMLFMVLLVVWVSAASSRATLDYSARIPLADDVPPIKEDKLP